MGLQRARVFYGSKCCALIGGFVPVLQSERKVGPARRAQRPPHLPTSGLPNTIRKAWRSSIRFWSDWARSARRVERHPLADINPSFKDDAHIIPTPPEEPALCNGEKAIEREVEIYRKKAQSVGVHHGVRPANVVSLNAQFAANVKEQQASYGMLDHVALQSVLAALALALQERMINRR